MNVPALLAGLNRSNPADRLTTTRVIALVEETRALAALRARYQTETAPEVREAIAWAGKLLAKAQQAGYSTLDELFSHFNLNREIEAMEDPDVEKALRDIQYTTDMDVLASQDRSNLKNALATGAAVALGGGIVQPGAAAASSNLGEGIRTQLAAKRTPPTMPATVDINVWTTQLATATTPSAREKAIIELRNLNNPGALPHLANAFVTDPSEDVRQAARRAGKILYWGALYWQMTEDGSLDAEIQRRLRARGKAAPAPGGSPAKAPPPEDVGSILRQAQAKKRRSRGRR